MNVKILDQHSKLVVDYFNFLRFFGLSIQNSLPTRNTIFGSSCPDHIIHKVFRTLGNVQCKISDHFALKIDFHLGNLSKKLKSLVFEDFSIDLEAITFPASSNFFHFL